MNNEWEPGDEKPLLGVKARVLDHGYFAVVETWGSDERIIEAARMSTQEGKRHEYSPRWAAHVRGWYFDRVIEDGEPQEARVGATCEVCGESFERKCKSGLMRNHVASFAMSHVHLERAR